MLEAGHYDLVKASLLDQTCTAVEPRGELLTLHWKDVSLFVSAPWRVTSADWIVGSSSHPDLMQQLPKRLVGSTIVAVEIRAPWHDLRIAFSNGTSLELFQNCERY